MALIVAVYIDSTVSVVQALLRGYKVDEEVAFLAADRELNRFDVTQIVQVVFEVHLPEDVAGSALFVLRKNALFCVYIEHFHARGLKIGPIKLGVSLAAVVLRWNKKVFAIVCLRLSESREVIAVVVRDFQSPENLLTGGVVIVDEFIEAILFDVIGNIDQTGQFMLRLTVEFRNGSYIFKRNRRQ